MARSRGRRSAARTLLATLLFAPAAIADDAGELRPADEFKSLRDWGAPLWHLAPRKMAWEGLSLGEIWSRLSTVADLPAP